MFLLKNVSKNQNNAKRHITKIKNTLSKMQKLVMNMLEIFGIKWKILVICKLKNCNAITLKEL